MTLWLCFLAVKIPQCANIKQKQEDLRVSVFFLPLIIQLMLLMAACFWSFSPSVEQIGELLVTVAMTTAGAPVTGVKFAFHGIDWARCSIYPRRVVGVLDNINMA